MARCPRTSDGRPAGATPARALLALLLALALASCATARNYLDPAGPRFAGTLATAVPPATAPTAVTVVTVVTFNIKYALHVDRAIELFRDSPRLRAADLIALQEMDEPGVLRLARALSLNYVYYPAAVHPKHHRDFGNALLSPWPLRDDRKIALPHPGRFRKMQRIAVAATVEVAGVTVRAYSVHLETPASIGGQGRADQVRTILADAQPYPRVVVAGDFNSRGIGGLFERSGFRWTTKRIGHTLTLFTWDHVFVKGLLAGEAPAAGVLRDNRSASDHRPVWTVIRIDPVVSEGGRAGRTPALQMEVGP